MERNQLSWISGKLEEKKTLSYGSGLFANKKITEGEVIAVFGGHVMRIAEENQLEGNLSDYSLQISDDLVIGPAFTDEINKSELFNHSCDPNAGFRGQIILEALRDIEPGEQVTFDYAMVIAGNEPYEMKCECQAGNCRSMITHLDWKIPELQNKYNGYFQYYIQKKIK